jgi:hypothetical protein
MAVGSEGDRSLSSAACVVGTCRPVGDGIGRTSAEVSGNFENATAFACPLDATGHAHPGPVRFLFLV